jgi:hypothetical protein
MSVRIIEERFVTPMTCSRCKHSWNYTGKNPYVATCPFCRTKLSISKNSCKVPQQTVPSYPASLSVTHKDPKEVAPLVDLIVDSNILKSFDINQCLTKTCDECTGSYSGLGIKVRCRCSCHKGDD